MIIAARFNGPPGTGNGGYSAGLFASLVPRGGHGVAVTLRRPPPLDTELTAQIDGLDDGAVRVFAGPDLIAEATPSVVGDDEAVSGVPFVDAVAASASYRGFVTHPFPTCFVCGPQREPGDGLRLFPGRLTDGRTAAPFVAPRDVSPEIVWASLDCPGGWAVPLDARPFVLGQMTARVDAVPVPGDECVVIGECVGEQGRKAFVRSTLYSSTGEVLAIARATWLAIA